MGSAKQNLRKTWVAKALMLGYTLHNTVPVGWWYVRAPDGTTVHNNNETPLKLRPNLPHPRFATTELGDERPWFTYEWEAARAALKHAGVFNAIHTTRESRALARLAGKLPRRKRQRRRVQGALKGVGAATGRNS